MFSEQLAACNALLDAALADPGFCSLLESISTIQARDRGFTQAFPTGHPDAGNDERRARAERDFAELVRRAKATGRLRQDFSPHDLVLILLATGGVTVSRPDVAESVSRRLVAYLLQAFEARPTTADSSLPPHPEVGIQAGLDAPQPS